MLQVSVWEKYTARNSKESITETPTTSNYLQLQHAKIWLKLSWIATRKQNRIQNVWAWIARFIDIYKQNTSE